MKYAIRELDTFSVIGQEIELKNYQKRAVKNTAHLINVLFTHQSMIWIAYRLYECPVRSSIVTECGRDKYIGIN